MTKNKSMTWRQDLRGREGDSLQPLEELDGTEWIYEISKADPRVWRENLKFDKKIRFLRQCSNASEPGHTALP